MDSLNIMGILVDKRTHSAPKLQEVLTRYGDSILSRVGIHDPGEKEHGLITLNVRDKAEKVFALEKELNSLEGVQAKTITMK